MKEVKREDIKISNFQEIFEKESHHTHPIYADGNNKLRWKENHEVNDLLASGQLNLNDLVYLLHALGFGKNSEVYRKLYRDMGYSLDGYWEIFYWEVNNPNADKYQGPSEKN